MVHQRQHRGHNRDLVPHGSIGWIKISIVDPCPGKHTRLDHRPGGEEDGLEGIADACRDVRQRARAVRVSGWPGGLWTVSHAASARRRARRDWRIGSRVGASCVRSGDRLRQRTPHFRRAYRAASGHSMDDCRCDDVARSGAPAGLQSRVAQGERQAVHQRGIDGEVVCHRSVREGVLQRDSDSRRLRLQRGVSGRTHLSRSTPDDHRRRDERDSAAPCASG